MKITDTMVLALLKKGFAYEAKNIDVEMETEVPLSVFTLDEDNKETMKVKMTCKVGDFSVRIMEED